MIIVFGSRLFGKVDEVPGLFHVATVFGHVWYLPLIPLGSRVVIGEGEDGWLAAPIGLSAKSVLIAWLRAALICVGLATTVLGIPLWSDGPASAATLTAISLGAWAVLAWTMKSRAINRASYARAHQLAEQVGLGEASKVWLDAAYCVIDEAEARASLQALAEAEQATPGPSAT